MRVLIHEWGALSDPFDQSVRNLMREYAQVVMGTLRDLSPGKSEKELRAAAFGLFGMLTWVDQWFRPDRDLPLDLLADEFSNIFLRGFLSAPPKDRKREPDEERGPSKERSKQTSTSSILSGPGF
jgi:hypothetical protein